jgi:hypothetical protein
MPNVQTPGSAPGECGSRDLAIDPQPIYSDSIPQGRDHLGDIVQSARLSVCEALVYRGQGGALEALVSASRLLASWVHQGGLLHCAAFDELQAVAENIGLVRAFGRDEIQRAMSDGVLAYVSARQCAA